MALPPYRVNNQITSPELRVIDDAEQNLGVFPLAEALKMAKDKGLDLIEVVPGAKPPVARIISFDKFRYQQEKKLKKQRASHKTGGNKQVQISIREAKNDLMMKAARVNEFLAEGYQVEIFLTLRGREKGNKDFARKKLAEFVTLITPEHQVIASPSLGMRGFIMSVAKSR